MMIGDKIKALREELRMTQEKLAKDMDLNINTLASYERNIREPKIELILKFAQYFRVTTDYILGVSDYRTVDNIVISNQINLSDKSINYIRQCPEAYRTALDCFLRSRYNEEFWNYLLTYLKFTHNPRRIHYAELLSNKLSEGLEEEDTISTFDILEQLDERKMLDVETTLHEVIEEMRISFDGKVYLNGDNPETGK